MLFKFSLVEEDCLEYLLKKLEIDYITSVALLRSEGLVCPCHLRGKVFVSPPEVNVIACSYCRTCCTDVICKIS